MLRGLLRFSSWRLAVSPVATRANVTVDSLSYSPGYVPYFRKSLARKYNVVDEKNRYQSLDILLTRLSSHVGRRQYRMMNNLVERHLQSFKDRHLDWHGIKALPRGQLLDLLTELKMTPSEKAIFMTAVHSRVCGVLTEGTARDPQTICLRNGIERFGWRCGVRGHGSDIYFENKPGALPHAIAPHIPSSTRVSTVGDGAGSTLRGETEESRLDGSNTVVQVHDLLDFSVEGRLPRNDIHPRVWNAPFNPTFDIFCIGFEFLVSPADPRAKVQIVDAADAWRLHAEALRHVISETLELNATVTDPQPLDLEPGELHPADLACSDSAGGDLRNVFIDFDDENGVTIERRLRDPLTGKVYPWFTPAPPRRWVHGVPENLPFAPSIVIRCVYKSPLEPSDLKAAAEGVPPTLRRRPSEASFRAPLCEITCLSHPKACFWASPEEEQRITENIVEFAQKIPFALPFNLYFRVDPAAKLRPDQSSAPSLLAAERERRSASKKDFFDLSKYCDNTPAEPAATPAPDIEVDLNGSTDDDENPFPSASEDWRK